MRIETLWGEKERAQERYDSLVERDQDRYDDLLSKQKEILDQQLGLVEGRISPSASDLRPLGKPGWNRVAAAYEKKQRVEADSERQKKEEYWRAKAAEVENGEKSQTKAETKEKRG